MVEIQFQATQNKLLDIGLIAHTRVFLSIHRDGKQWCIARAQNRDGVQGFGQGVIALRPDRQEAVLDGEGEVKVRRRRDAQPVVDVRRAECGPVCRQGDEQGVAAQARLLDGVRGRREQEDRGTTADVHGDVSQGRIEGGVPAWSSVDDLVGVPVAPDLLAPTGEDA